MDGFGYTAPVPLSVKIGCHVHEHDRYVKMLPMSMTRLNICCAEAGVVYLTAVPQPKSVPAAVQKQVQVAGKFFV